MSLAILGILGTILSAIWFIARRAMIRADSPDEIRRKHSEQIAHEILDANPENSSESANRRLDDILRIAALRRDRQRQGRGALPAGKRAEG